MAGAVRMRVGISVSFGVGRRGFMENSRMPEKVPLSWRESWSTGA